MSFSHLSCYDYFSYNETKHFSFSIQLFGELCSGIVLEGGCINIFAIGLAGNVATSLFKISESAPVLYSILLKMGQRAQSVLYWCIIFMLWLEFVYGTIWLMNVLSTLFFLLFYQLIKHLKHLN